MPFRVGRSEIGMYGLDAPKLALFPEPRPVPNSTRKGDSCAFSVMMFFLQSGSFKNIYFLGCATEGFENTEKTIVCNFTTQRETAVKMLRYLLTD